jgi:hypothetical protein
MIIAETGLEQVLKTLGKLRPEELEVVEKQLTHEKAKPKVSSSPKTLLEDERYLISFEDYLALSDEEGEELQLLAYEKYRNWIYQELAKRRARWMIVCGGKIIEWSSRLNDYPSEEKMDAIGKQFGYAPFVFIANPVIEESYWTALPEDDFYPTLSITLGAANWDETELIKKGLKIDADFDTGSTDVLCDYNHLREMSIIKSQLAKRTQSGYHMGQHFSCYVVPVQIALTDEARTPRSKTISIICVRNWQLSSLFWVNPLRKVLAGRNLLLEFPLRVELNGRDRTTKILTESE